MLMPVRARNRRRDREGNSSGELLGYGRDIEEKPHRNTVHKALKEWESPSVEDKAQE
jgi:hypothetical protein